MKIVVGAAALLLTTAPVVLHAQEGLSKPPVENYTSDSAKPIVAPSVPQPKPSAAIPMTPQAAPQVVSSSALPAPPTQRVVQDQDADVVTSVPSLHARAVEDADADKYVVTSLAARGDELPTGTVIKVRLSQDVSTISTPEGAPFEAQVMDAIERDGRVVIPSGAMIEGRVTEVRGGKRIHGSAMVHLEPQKILLPDGTHLIVHAQVIDTNQFTHTKIDGEGNIIRRNNAQGTLAVAALTTGGAAAAGAVFGGAPGALIGAGVGAAVSTVVWLKQDRQLQLAKDSEVFFSLTVPMITTPLKNNY